MPDDCRYDGWDAPALARELGLPRVVLRASTPSTLDTAHALAAAGAPAGTLVLADEQTAGRGRGGRRWSSRAGAGIWLTLIERPVDAAALDVLSLRLGLHAARALDPFTADPVRLKWPNDLFAGEGKLAGILVEARWQATTPEWVAIGFGLNVLPPDDVATAASLEPGASRPLVLARLVPALRAAARAAGPLTPDELGEYAARDAAAGRACHAPALGTVRGITAAGELVVATADGAHHFRSGSLAFAEDS